MHELAEQGICYSCYDQETGELFGDREQDIVYEDALFKVVLEPYPRMRGHTIVVFKPHREDISALSEDEACLVARACLRVIQAIKEGLGTEKVFLNTMCDGPIN